MGMPGALVWRLAMGPPGKSLLLGQLSLQPNT